MFRITRWHHCDEFCLIDKKYFSYAHKIAYNPLVDKCLMMTMSLSMYCVESIKDYGKMSHGNFYK